MLRQNQGTRCITGSGGMILAICMLTGLLVPQSAILNAQELTAELVRQRIESGVRFLRNNQEPNGSWPDLHRFRGGTTALATLALLNAGESPSDPRIQKAIDFIIAVPDTELTTYVASLRVMVLVAADPKGKIYKLKIKKDVRWLLDQQVSDGASPNLGGWYYPMGGGNSADGSNTQFAMLALHEATRVGVEIDEVYWQRSLQFWRKLQNRNGSFNYGLGSSAKGSMTCAGISSVIIAQENLVDLDLLLADGQVACCRPDLNSEMVERAIEWMGRAFTIKTNPTSRRRGGEIGSKLYYLYGMERAGRLSGRRFFGPHDWYRAGAEELISMQSRINGSWQGSAGGAERDLTIATSFGLLFLAKGKRPVAIGKYKNGADGDWDRHAKGVHFLTRELEDQWGTKLNWQTIDGDNGTLNDLLEAPVLFISGRDQLDLTQVQKDALKKYVENGNFIFAEACEGNGCGINSRFDQKFRELMNELFPDTQLQPLAVDHPIWNSQFPVSPRKDWVLYGLQACCRTSVVYCQRSLSCHWQLNRPNVLNQLPQRALDDVQYATQVGVNVVSYATGRQLRDKLDMPQVDTDSVSLLANRALVLPKLSHAGGSDDAPNAWRRLLEQASKIGLRIDLNRKIIAPEFDQLADYPFVFMHGRSSFRFTDQQREAIREYLQGGNRGFILCDSICSSQAFTDSFRREMKAILPEYPLQPIPADHPVWSDGQRGFGGYPIGSVTITKPDRNEPDGFSRKNVAPQLDGIDINGRLAVVFSKYDLSCALENATVSQCEGYTREDATKICINILLYRLNRD